MQDGKAERGKRRNGRGKWGKKKMEYEYGGNYDKGEGEAEW